LQQQKQQQRQQKNHQQYHRRYRGTAEAGTDRTSANDTVSDGYNYYWCIPLIEPIETIGIRQFFQSDEWQMKHSLDYLLYQAVNVSLDRTIATIEVQLRNVMMSSSSSTASDNEQHQHGTLPTTTTSTSTSSWSSYLLQKLTTRHRLRDHRQSSSSESLFQLLVEEYNEMQQYAQTKCIVETGQQEQQQTSSSIHQHDNNTNDDYGTARKNSSVPHHPPSSSYYYYQPPCSDDGVPQYNLSKYSCHERDFGCGHSCVVQELVKRQLLQQ
jgi:hypothetical protein